MCKAILEVVAASNTFAQNTCCGSHTINDTTAKRNCGGLKYGHGRGVQNNIQHNQGYPFWQQMATTNRRAHKLLYE
jgi:hypothetical protein